MIIALPSVQVDTVTETAAAGVDELVANRNPQPDELQVPLRAPVVFEHITLTGNSPDLSAFVVSVGGVVAYDNGYQNGWTGLVQDGTPDSASIRFTLYPPADYPQGSRIIVDVSTDSGFSATWGFLAHDLAAPSVVEAVAVAVDRVTVTFTEPVLMENATGPSDALNPANYVIERVSRPAATPTVKRVERVNASQVVLELSFEMTFGASYMLVCSDVADEYDNVILPPTNIARFKGFSPPFPPGRRFFLADFVPSVALGLDSTDDLKLFVACLQDSVNLLLFMIDRWVEILDPDLAPESFVDAMLADMGNPFTDLGIDLDLVTKRKLAKLLVRIYGLKGTAVGIIDVVRFLLGVEVEIDVFNTGTAWRLGIDRFSTEGTLADPNPAIIGPSRRVLYSFRVRTAAILTAKQRASIEKIALWMKGVQEHLLDIVDATAGPPTPLIQLTINGHGLITKYVNGEPVILG